MFEDGFGCSRCLNNHIDLPDMIVSFASGAMASLVAKNGAKKLLHNCPKVYFWMLLFKRGPKAPGRARRAPKPSAGARRRGTERPELLVIIIIVFRYYLKILNPLHQLNYRHQYGNIR